MGVERGRRAVVALVATGALVAAGAAVAPSAEAATTVLTTVATADTYADSANPTRANGSAGFLLSRGTPGEISYLRFTLPAFPAGTTLTAVSLRVRTTSDAAAGSASPHTIRVAPDTWTESGLTWNTQPAGATSGTLLGTLTGAAARNSSYSTALAITPLATLSGRTLSITMASTTTDGLYFLPRTTGSTANRPTLSLTFTTTTGDTAAPTAPSGLSASVTGSNVALGWTASTDDVGVTAYDVHRSSTQGFTPSAQTLVASTATTGFTDSARPVGTWYYRVIARDAVGNASSPSGLATAVIAPPPDVTSPSQVLNLAGTVTGSTVGLTWSASTDDVGVTAYDVHRSSADGFTPGPSTLLASTAALAWTDSGVAPGTWFYRVVARDLVGNQSTPSAVWSGVVVAPSDVTAPTAPTGLGGQVTGSSVALTWLASSDDTAVTAYDVHRSTDPAFTPVPATLLGTTATLGWVDPAAPAGTQHYRVVARDAVGNASTPSAAWAAVIAPATTDSGPPSTPTGLAVSAPGTSPLLSWAASSDDVGVTGYELHRSTDPAFVPSPSSLLGTTAALSLADSSVPTGAWFYRVVARDAAGNSSAPSSELAVRTISGAGSTLSVESLADTYGNFGAAGSNFGSSASLASRGGLYVSWLRYVLPAQPGTAPLASVTLRLRTTSDPASTSVDTHTVSFGPDTWSESTLTWANQPSISGPAVGTVGPAPAASSPLTSQLDPAPFRSRLGQQVTLTVSDNGVDSLWFWSRNQTTAASRPWLDLTFAGSVVALLEPPASPTGLVTSVGAGTVHLAWVAPNVPLPIVGYEVETSTDPAFPAAATTRVTGIPGTTYDDHNKAIGTYWYRVTAVDVAGNRSAPSAATSAAVVATTGDVTVLAVGDLVCQPGSAITSTTCRHADVATMIANADPDWYMPLGDIQYELGTYADFTSPQGYDGAFAQFRPRTLPVIGNHEYADPAGPGNGYFRYFDPQTTGQYGANPDAYYTRTLGSWRLVVINSECSVGIENAQHMLAGGCAVGSPEYTWLESVLSTSTEMCTIAAFHRPRWSSGTASTNPSSYPEMGPMWDLLVRYGVEIGVSGHKHDSEVFVPIGQSGTGDPVADPLGVRQFVAGAGGKNFGPFDPITIPAGQLTVARDNSTFGGLKLTLRDGSYDWGFVPVAGQTFRNAGTTGAFSGTGVTCH